MGHSNDVYATAGWDGSGSDTATGINVGNLALAANGSYGYAAQSLSMGDYNRIDAYSAYGNATGINTGLTPPFAGNTAIAIDGSSAYAGQSISLGSYNIVDADTGWLGNGTATGINLSNAAAAKYGSDGMSAQTLSMEHWNPVSAYSAYGSATGMPSTAATMILDLWERVRIRPPGIGATLALLAVFGIRDLLFHCQCAGLWFVIQWI